MNAEGLERHLREPVPTYGHGYGEDDLAQAAEKFHGSLDALHEDDHRSEAWWALRIQMGHYHEDEADRRSLAQLEDNP